MKTGTFFEINVSQKGRHIFATDSTIRSYTHDQIVELLILLGQKFPPDEEYEFSVTSWTCSAGVLPDIIFGAIPKKGTV